MFKRGHEDDQSDGDVGDQALHVQGVKQGFVLLLPVGGHEALASRVFELAGNFVGLVDVVDLELDY